MMNRKMSNIIEALNEGKTFGVYRIVGVGDFSSDKMPLGEVSGTLREMKKEAEKKYGKIVSVDITKKEIVVEGKSQGDIIKTLKSLKFGEEVDDLHVGDWTIDVWSNVLSYGKVYIIQVENGNREYNMPDLQNEADWNRAIDKLVKKIG